MHLVRSRGDHRRVAGLQSLDHCVDFGAERAGRAEQLIVESGFEDAALGRVEVGDVLFERLEIGDQRVDSRGIAAAHEVVGLLPERIGLGDEIGPERRLHVVVDISRCRVEQHPETARSR